MGTALPRDSVPKHESTAAVESNGPRTALAAICPFPLKPPNAAEDDRTPWQILKTGGMDAMVLRRLTGRLHSAIQALSKSAFVTAVLCGAFIATLLVSATLTWTLTWSDDRPFACAAVLMLALGVVIGRRSPSLGLSELAVAAGTWTLLLPWLVGAMTALMRFIPPAALSAEFSRLLIALILAAPVWSVAGWLWSSLAEAAILRTARGSIGLSLGAAVGLCLSACVVGPWLGTWCTVACAVILVIAARFLPGLGPSVTTENENSPPTNVDRTTILEVATSVTSATALGGLFAVVIRLLGQLMPNGSQIGFLEWTGLAIGCAVGLQLQRRSIRFAWFTLVPAASGALLLAALPTIVDALLWANSSLTSVTLLVAFRASILVVATFPIGLCGAGLTQRTPPHFWLFLITAAGFTIAQFSLVALGPVTILAACSIALVLSGAASLIGPTTTIPSWPRLAGMTCCALLGLSVPLWTSHDNPSQIAKLLFSTPSFVAHRAGWDSRLLPVLDDARSIDVREGLRGPLTLWRSHGLELHLRENGIPRAIVSADTRVQPQFAPEVLQVVYPMVFAQQSQQILLLGASGGVPLATCLQFPVIGVTCAESDRQLLDVVRGPVARETGFDPFSDDRVHILAAPPAIALMTNPGTFDIILSSPPSSSIVAGGAMFTVDYYQNASRGLAAGGVFCQRFECVDYGPDPLRTVVSSMRQSFREVMAIETAAGEMLLFGTNTASVFNPEDLPARLEVAHVRRVLARSGLDWSTLLNLPAYDHAALGEICSESRTWANTPGNGLLALRGPLELMRWGPKLLEVQAILTADRTTSASYSPEDPTNPDGAAGPLSRKSRLLEWLGPEKVSADLLRRLSEVATQHKLVRENPDAHWWEYRKELRQQLQNRPRGAVDQVSHSADQPMHPEDARRKDYFTALGAAAREPSHENIGAMADLLEPYDPLLSYFARQEIADLQAKGQSDAATELANRLHVIYFAPTIDASTRNVATAIELLIHNPETIPDPSRRFDVLNGLVQTMRTRWETRQGQVLKTPRRQMSDVDRSVVAIDKAVQVMSTLHTDAQFSDADWESRKQVIERMLLRPLHAYRAQLQATASRSESRAQAAMKEATEPQK